MNKFSLYILGLVFIFITSCSNETQVNNNSKTEFDPAVEKLDATITGEDGFVYKTEEFADVKILRYKIAGWDQLTEDQKKLCYYLYQAGLSGRDIIYDQNNKYNLRVRRALENIYKNYTGNKEHTLWKNFRVYLKRIWFANGIHHHYGYKKFKPGFSKEYLKQLAVETGTEISEEIYDVIFNNEIEAMRVNKAKGVDIITESSNNFYEGVTLSEVDSYYGELIDEGGDRPVSYGLNSKTVIRDGEVVEIPWKVDGMYSGAIEQIVYWFEKALEVAENEYQRQAMQHLIDYYETGDLALFDEFNKAWVKDTESVVDYINGFIEVYGDARGLKGSYESVVQIKDFAASERMATLDQNVQWFEDNSPILPEHKKEDVKGVSYKVITVIGESGDASPSTPIGINLPNSPWIRKEHGSKSVSLGNIISAYDEAAGKGMLEEFAFNEEQVERSKNHGALAGKLHTALHEVVGHASGQLEPGVQTYQVALKNYASTLEEARADLVALYYILDPKMIELGLMESLEVAKAEYDGYIRNGLMLQLRRLELGEQVQQDHMRNRQMISKWVYEKGQEENVIEKVMKDEKTYFVINDYDKLRGLFGDLLREVQRIKSQGDLEACTNLVETYGVQVDQELHQEVLNRVEPLKSAPYGGFINPVLKADIDADGNASNIRVEYMDSFEEQMLFYSENYSFLPDVN